jgi:hypothetical protein
MRDAAFDDAARAQLAEGARVVAERGLVVGSAGNLSMRRGGRVLITPRGALLEALDPRECVEIDLDDARLGCATGALNARGLGSEAGARDIDEALAFAAAAPHREPVA